MEVSWKAIMNVDCIFEFITFNSTVHGQDAVWAFRQGLTANNDNTRLDWGLYVDSHSMGSDGVLRAKSGVVVHKNDGSAYEIGALLEIIEWTATFNDEGLIDVVTVEQLWYDYSGGDFGRRQLSKLATPKYTSSRATAGTADASPKDAAVKSLRHLATMLPPPSAMRGAEGRQQLLKKPAYRHAPQHPQRRSLVTGDSFSTYISGPYGWNTAMIYWMEGDEKWKQVVDDNVHLMVPAIGIDCRGVSDCWDGVRASLTGGTISQLPWVNTFDTFSMVNGQLTCYMKSFTRDASKLMQVGIWNATFNDAGKVDFLSQEVVYASYADYSINDDQGASQYIHGPRGFNTMMK